jgi:RTX calcium-binding nonapeptide repeat (4 copies)
MFSRNRKRTLAVVAVAAIAVAAVTAYARPASGALQVGRTFVQNVIVGKDNDNAQNTFIQPANVTAKQHLDNTDVIVGGARGDLLIGMKGDDLLDGAGASDILVGGVERGQAPNSDLLNGGYGNDVNIWAPGDGSDFFHGGPGYDTHISAPIVLDGDNVALFRAGYRQVPHVSIDAKPQFTCTVERVPREQELGFDYITRFFANGNLAVTIRLQHVEQVLCPSPNAGKVLVARLYGKSAPTFVERPLSAFGGTLLGAIVQAPQS